MQSTDFMNTVIRKVLEEKMDNGYKRFLIFPYGEVGMKIKVFLNSLYGIDRKSVV